MFCNGLLREELHYEIASHLSIMNHFYFLVLILFKFAEGSKFQCLWQVLRQRFLFIISTFLGVTRQDMA